MLTKLLSGDQPRSRALTAILLLILICLAGAPFLFDGVRPLDTAARICIFIVLVASYDLLLGYAGIVSFAHTMFFGLGAYGVALASTHMGRGFDALIVGSVAGALAAVVLALMIGLFSLRVRAIFFAMITLAVASAVAVLVSQFSGLTGGEDGLTYKIPRVLTSANRMGEFLGTRISGKILNYYLIFFASLALFLLLLRIVNSLSGGSCRRSVKTISGPRQLAIAWSGIAPPPPACRRPRRRWPVACLRSGCAMSGRTPR